VRGGAGQWVAGKVVGSGYRGAGAEQDRAHA